MAYASRVVGPRVYVGWDPYELTAHVVATASLQAHSQRMVDIRRLALLELKTRGWYTRPTTATGEHRLWDVISEAPMSTEHAISRFFVPYLNDFRGWALFVDGDILARADIRELFALADPRYAVMCVQHPALPAEGTKKDGAVQQAYRRKNWSSVLLWNCAHPAHQALSLDALNTWPGRDLHAFNWLDDDEIGALPASWNYLVNVSALPPTVNLAHFTLGVPSIDGHAADPFADEWFAVARAAGYQFKRGQVQAV